MNRNAPSFRTFERILRTAVHLKFLFGSPRSSIVVLLVIGAILGLGYLAFRTILNPQASIIEADKLYESDKPAGVEKYRELLLKNDFWDPSKKLIVEDRPRFYRRIISFEARYGNRGMALDFSRQAWDEGIRGLTFEHEETTEIWAEATDPSGLDQRKSKKNRKNGRDVLSNNLLPDGPTESGLQDTNSQENGEKIQSVDGGPQPPDPDPENKAHLPRTTND